MRPAMAVRTYSHSILRSILAAEGKLHAMMDFEIGCSVPAHKRCFLAAYLTDAIRSARDLSNYIGVAQEHLGRNCNCGRFLRSLQELRDGVIPACVVREIRTHNQLG